MNLMEKLRREFVYCDTNSVAFLGGDDLRKLVNYIEAAEAVFAKDTFSVAELEGINARLEQARTALGLDEKEAK